MLLFKCVSNIIHHTDTFDITGPLWGESTNNRWIILTKGQQSFDVSYNELLNKQSIYKWLSRHVV